MKIYVIDGENFSTLEEFYDEISRVLIPGADWGRNLDALNDILRGGFGTPEDGFTLQWRNHRLSRQRLGYVETVRQLQMGLELCHPEDRQRINSDLDRAGAEEGPTVFDELVEIIRDHGPGGREAEDNVRLDLA